MSAPCNPKAATQSGAANFQSGKSILHNLKSRRDPLDTGERERWIIRGWHRRLEPEHHLWLDARLHKLRQVQVSPAVERDVDRVGPHVSPDRLPDPVAGPDGSVGKADLAADVLPSLAAPALFDCGEDAIAIPDPKPRHPHRDGRQCLGGVVGSDQVIGEIGSVDKHGSMPKPADFTGGAKSGSHVL